MIKSLRALALALLFVFPASSPLFAGSFEVKAAGLKFPESIGDLKRDKITEFEKEHPGLGVGIGYRHSRLPIFADIYVYNLGIKEIPAGSDNKLVHQQWKNAEGDIVIQTQKGVYQDVQLIRESSRLLGTSPSSPTALQTEYTYFQNKVPRYSYLFLTGHRNHFIKIRFTYPFLEKAVGEKTLQVLLNEMGKMIGK